MVYYHVWEARKERGKPTYMVININQFGRFPQKRGLTKSEADRLVREHNDNRK